MAFFIVVALTALSYLSSVWLVSFVLVVFACIFLWPVTLHLVKEERTLDGVLKTPHELLFISWVCRITQVLAYIAFMFNFVEVLK